MKQLIIKNYKNLDELQIDNIKNVNLITGENNVGKSSLLEGLSILKTGGQIEWLRQLLEFRGENFSYTTYTEDNNQKEIESFLSFIPNFDKKRMFDCTMEFASDENKVTIRFVRFTERITEENGVIRTIIENYDENATYANLGIALEIMTSSRKRFYPFNYPKSNLHPVTEGFANIQYVRMGDTQNVNNPGLFDQLALTPLQKEVVRALQIIEPRISDINFLKDNKQKIIQGKDLRVPYIVLDGETTPRRLSSMGDGINRILTIILSMLNCKEGILFIDEFENGLHYSVQRKLWRVIFELSQTLNIQVFATTHSNDTIRSFADENTRSAGSFIRLEQHNGKTRAINYSKNEELTFVLEQNIEVR